MTRVNLIVKSSKCRGGYCKDGDTYYVEDICPPICHELWNSLYPSVYTLLNGGTLDYGSIKKKAFEIKCPDEGRVIIYGELCEM